MPEQLVEGWTEPILQQLLNDGRSFDATGLTISLDLYNCDGKQISTSGKVSWSDASNAVAIYSPRSHDLRVSGSPYSARWKLTASGKVAYYPNAHADVWEVRR